MPVPSRRTFSVNRPFLGGQRVAPSMAKLSHYQGTLGQLIPAPGPHTGALSVPHRAARSALTAFPAPLSIEMQSPTRYGDDRTRPEPTRERHPPAQDRLRAVLRRREIPATHRYRVAHRHHAEALQRPWRGDELYPEVPLRQSGPGLYEVPRSVPQAPETKGRRHRAAAFWRRSTRD